MKPLLCATALLALLASGTALAGPRVDAAQQCLADSTTGKDRKLLGKWVFLAIAAHPEIKSLSAATPADNQAVSREFAALFTRLVTQDCRAEMGAMVSEEGAQSLEKAFEFLGQVAMQELMTHPDVNSTIAGFGEFLDQGKINAVLAPAQ